MVEAVLDIVNCQQIIETHASFSLMKKYTYDTVSTVTTQTLALDLCAK